MSNLDLESSIKVLLLEKSIQDINECAKKYEWAITARKLQELVDKIQNSYK